MICHFKKTSKASDLTPIYHNNIAYIHSQQKIHKEQIHSKIKPINHTIAFYASVQYRKNLFYEIWWQSTLYSFIVQNHVIQNLVLYKSWLKFTPRIRLSQLVKWTLVSWLVLSLLPVLLRIPLVVLGTTGSLDCSSDCDRLWPPARRITKQISLHRFIILAQINVLTI